MRNQDVVKLLKSAGLAVKALTKTISTSSGESPNQPVSLEHQKESFTAATSSYFALVSSLDVRLRRQIYALEEADILPAEASSKESQRTSAVLWGASATAGGSNAPPSRLTGSGKGAITGGGLGSLDLGWLNSRNDRVGKEMEAELWDQAQRFIRDLERGKDSKVQGADIRSEGDGAAMQSPQAYHISEQMEQN